MLSHKQRIKSHQLNVNTPSKLLFLAFPERQDPVTKVSTFYLIEQAHCFVFAQGYLSDFSRGRRMTPVFAAGLRRRRRRFRWRKWNRVMRSWTTSQSTSIEKKKLYVKLTFTEVGYFFNQLFQAVLWASGWVRESEECMKPWRTDICNSRGVTNHWEAQSHHRII